MQLLKANVNEYVRTQYFFNKIFHRLIDDQFRGVMNKSS
jgi:hypothetical protein